LLDGLQPILLRSGANPQANSGGGRSQYVC